MKKSILAVFILMLSQQAMADADKGQTYYLKYLRPYFDYNGQVFATQHLKIEWKNLFKNDGSKFIKKFTKKHPEAKEFLESNTFQKISPHVKDFVIKYAADSGALPNCT